MTETKIVELAGRLGYAYTQTPNAVRPLTEYILPMKPFTILWPFVLIRELIRDPTGIITARCGEHAKS